MLGLDRRLIHGWRGLLLLGELDDVAEWTERYLRLVLGILGGEVLVSSRLFPFATFIEIEKYKRLSTYFQSLSIHSHHSPFQPP